MSGIEKEGIRSIYTQIPRELIISDERRRLLCMWYYKI